MVHLMTINIRHFIQASLLFSFLLFGYSVFADSEFENWKREYRIFAIEQGISAETVDTAFRGLLPDPKIIENDSYQSEFVKPIWKYLESAISEKRLSTAKKMLQEHHELLTQIEQRYGVQREYLVAIWGIESNFGSNYGDKSIIRSLATLAYQGRRQDFGKKQLLAALRIIDKGDVAPSQMIGSWAGAMGQTQFIPTTYEAYAVDFDGDGKRNLINSIPDALASTANYLAKSGWKSGESWGQEVKLPEDFAWSLADMQTWLGLGCWQHTGITQRDTNPLAHIFAKNTDKLSAILLPAGHTGPAFLVNKNFKVIKRYNNANSYALAVSYLSNQMMDRAGIIAKWPTDDVMLTRTERTELQQILTDSGFDTKGVDGRVGPNTRKALRAWQQTVNVVPDGYINKKLFEYLKTVAVIISHPTPEELAKKQATEETESKAEDISKLKAKQNKPL